MYGFLSVIAYLVGATTVVSCLVMGSMVLMEPAKQPAASAAHPAHAQAKSVDLAVKHTSSHAADLHHEVKAVVHPEKKVARVHAKQRVHKKPAVKYAKQRHTTSSASAYAYAPEEPQRTLFGVPLLFSNGAAN